MVLYWFKSDPRPGQREARLVLARRLGRAVDCPLIDLFSQGSFPPRLGRVRVELVSSGVELSNIYNYHHLTSASRATPPTRRGPGAPGRRPVSSPSSARDWWSRDSAGDKYIRIEMNNSIMCRYSFFHECYLSKLDKFQFMYLIRIKTCRHRKIVSENRYVLFA